MVQAFLSRYLSYGRTARFSTAPHAMERLHAKVAIVTGGASGIGEATARKFASNGARVIIADIQDGPGQSLAKDIQADYTHCDISQESQVAAAVDLAMSKYGSLDIMFNNAGIVTGPKPSASFSTLDMPDFEAVFNVNVKGTAHGVKHAARAMIPAKSGTIISTASIAHLTAGFSLHSYTISKHAVVGITKSAACELAYHGIRVNSISPAGVTTNLVQEFQKHLVPTSAEAGKKLRETMVAAASEHDLRKLVDPEDIAKVALFLASDESKFVSGLDLVVDGGLTVAGLANIFKAIQQGLLAIKS